MKTRTSGITGAAFSSAYAVPSAGGRGPTRQKKRHLRVACQENDTESSGLFRTHLGSGPSGIVARCSSGCSRTVFMHSGSICAIDTCIGSIGAQSQSRASPYLTARHLHQLGCGAHLVRQRSAHVGHLQWQTWQQGVREQYECNFRCDASVPSCRAAG